MTKDWRLERLETQPWLRAVSFVRMPYRAYRADWDHDHCAACWAKFAELNVPEPECLHEGYATTASYVHGAEYEWVCPPCFSQFAGDMDWTDVKQPANGDQD